MNEISFPQLGFDLTVSRSFTLFGFRIYWYGVIIAVGFVLAFIYCLRRAARFGIKQNDVIDTAIVAMPSAIVGCRIMYVLCNLDQYKGHFWDVFKIWEGGIAIYGGLILAIICIVLLCRKKKISFFNLADMVVCGLLIGQVIGRWGNFVNGEAYGVDVENFILGMSINGNPDVHPIFLYESVWNLIGLVILHFASNKRRFYGQIFLGYVAWYGVGRGVIEAIRDENVLYITMFGTEFRISQVIAFASALVAVGILVYKLLFTDRAEPIMLATKEAAAAFRAEEKAAEKQQDEARAAARKARFGFKDDEDDGAAINTEEQPKKSSVPAGWSETLDDGESDGPEVELGPEPDVTAPESANESETESSPEADAKESETENQPQNESEMEPNKE